MTNLLKAMAAAGGGAAGGYEVDNSVRFNDDDSAYMSRTPTSAGNRDVWTLSVWVKPADWDTTAKILHAGDSSDFTHIYFSHATATDSNLEIVQKTSAAYDFDIYSTMQLRDPTSWYHILVKYNSGAGSGSRILAWVNNVAVSWTQRLSRGTEPSSGLDSHVNNTVAHYIGRANTAADYWDGYMSQFALIDGTAYDTTDFGELDDEGEWRPKDVTGLTFGTNGFLQGYSDSSHFGKDTQSADPATPTVTPPTINFDGTNDYLTATDPVPDGELGLFSAWVKFNGGDGSDQQILFSTGSYFTVKRHNNGKIYIIGYDSSAAAKIEITSTGVYLADNTYHHIMASWQTSVASHLWIDGVDVKNQVTLASGDIDYTRGTFVVGATDAAADKLNGDIAQLYFTNEYLDLSSSGNRDKFFSTSDNGPVDVGSTGATPTGTQALILLNNTLSTWHTNKGSATAFTEQGALTAGSGDVVLDSRNHFSDSGLAASDQVSDSPTNNYCVMTPLYPDTGTFSNGNLTAVTAGNDGDQPIGSMSFDATDSDGFYFEMIPTGTSSASYPFAFGVVTVDHAAETPRNNVSDARSWAFAQNGGAMQTSYIARNTWNSGESRSAPATGANGLTYMIAVKNGGIYFGHEGAWWNGDDTFADATPAFTGLTGQVVPFFQHAHASDGTVNVNFGSTGYDQTKPTGLKDICTANMTASTFGLDDEYQQVLDTEANISATLATARTTFSSYVERLKNRDSTEGWLWRFSHDTGNEYISYSAVNTYQADRTLSGSDKWIGEAWKVNGSAKIRAGSVAHTNGADTSVSYTDVGTARCRIFLFRRAAGGKLSNYHPDFTAGTLDDLTNNNAPGADVDIKNVTSSGFDIDTGETTGTHDYFVIPESAIFKMGTYEGNGAADGCVINVGLKPRAISLKSIDSSSSYAIFHDLREGYNADNDELALEHEAGEGSTDKIDLLSNGAKMRTTGDPNVGETNVYDIIGHPILNKSETPAKAR